MGFVMCVEAEKTGFGKSMECLRQLMVLLRGVLRGSLVPNSGRILDVGIGRLPCTKPGAVSGDVEFRGKSGSAIQARTVFVLAAAIPWQDVCWLCFSSL